MTFTLYCKMIVSILNNKLINKITLLTSKVIELVVLGNPLIAFYMKSEFLKNNTSLF